jgi:Flp pilus assembly pilin Flp
MGLFSSRPARRLPRRFRTDRRGVVAAEYAIMAVGIVIVVGAAVVTLADPNRSAFVVMGQTVASTQASMQANIGGGGSR